MQSEVSRHKAHHCKLGGEIVYLYFVVAMVAGTWTYAHKPCNIPLTVNIAVKYSLALAAQLDVFKFSDLLCYYYYYFI